MPLRAIQSTMMLAMAEQKNAGFGLESLDHLELIGAHFEGISADFDAKESPRKSLDFAHLRVI